MTALPKIPTSGPLIRALRARVLPRLAPLWQRRLARQTQAGRVMRLHGLTLEVGPGVFPPVFLSTGFVARALQRRRLAGQRVLELGCGTGLLSVLAAQQGAKVTAVDIAPAAIESCARNADRNGVTVETLRSDLFGALDGRLFDLILINPPYYPRMPQTDAERAWFCGEDFGYFRRLFAGLAPHVGAEILMVLSEDCALEHISELAAQAGWHLVVDQTQRRWFEWNYLFRIVPRPAQSNMPGAPEMAGLKAPSVED